MSEEEEKCYKFDYARRDRSVKNNRLWRTEWNFPLEREKMRKIGRDIFFYSKQSSVFSVQFHVLIFFRLLRHDLIKKNVNFLLNFNPFEWECNKLSCGKWENFSAIWRRNSIFFLRNIFIPKDFLTLINMEIGYLLYMKESISMLLHEIFEI